MKWQPITKQFPELASVRFVVECCRKQKLGKHVIALHIKGDVWKYRCVGCGPAKGGR